MTKVHSLNLTFRERVVMETALRAFRLTLVNRNGENAAVCEDLADRLASAASVSLTYAESGE